MVGKSAIAGRPYAQQILPKRQAMQILIVDDDAFSADARAKLLAHRRFVASVAYDGRTGIAVGVAHHFDVYLLDLRLADVNGYEVARAVRARHGPDVRIIAYTGESLQSVKSQALASGFDHLLVKPASIDANVASLTQSFTV
jgi:two-component system, sensor histidine kinase